MKRAVARWLLAVFYGVAGYFHLAAPVSFLKIMPPWVPSPDTVVALTGVAELLGSAGLAQPWSRTLRQVAGTGLALYALCVWPANFHHMALDLARPDHGWGLPYHIPRSLCVWPANFHHMALDLARPDHGWGLPYHIPRLLAQPLIIWLALWAGEATDWPFARAKSV